MDASHQETRGSGAKVSSFAFVKVRGKRRETTQRSGTLAMRWKGFLDDLRHGGTGIMEEAPEGAA